MALPNKILIRILLASVEGLPLLLICFTLLQVWVAPLSIDNGGWLRLASTLIIIEFLLLHSGAFMAVGSVLFGKFWQRFAWFLGFGLFYGAGAIFYAHWTEGNYVIWLLLTVLIKTGVTH